MFLTLRDDIREAVRRVRRNPRLTLLAVGTLALGIGASTAIFTIAHTALYAPPPFRAADRLVALTGHTPQLTARARSAGVSDADVHEYLADGLARYATLVSYGEVSWTGQSLPGFGGAEVLRGLAVTPDYFRVFDHRMALGRGFLPDEGPRGREAVVLSYSLWQRRFGGRPDVVGQTMTLDGNLHTIVGVAGADFLTYEPYEVLAWVPFVPRPGGHDQRGWSCYARLADGVSIEQAQQRADAVNARLAEAFPESYTGYYKGYTVHVEPMQEEVRRAVRPAVVPLVAAVLCLLLIAAANVAGLLLAKATTEAREMSIRTALGAGRMRLFRMVLVHSLVLALVAGIGGALIAVWILDGTRALLPASLQYGWMFVIDRRVFVAAFLVSTFAGLAAGLTPAFESFRMAAGGLRPSFHRSRALRAIVTAEIALAAFLSVGAGLLAKSFVALLNRPLGYQTENLLGMRVRLHGPRYRTVAQKGDYWAQLLERVGSLPGVSGATTVCDLPMGWQYIGGSFAVDGRSAGQGEMAHHLCAAPGYFGMLGIPVLAGRGFRDSDGPDAEKVAVVNDVLAGKFWPGQNPIGHTVSFGGEPRRIIGVVRRIRHGGPQDDYTNEVYAPYRQLNRETMFLVVRSELPADAVVPSIRRVLNSLDPDVPSFEIRTMDQAFEREIGRPRLPAVLTSGFAVLALALSGLGLFAVIAYWVSQRTKELGVRSALGARPRELRAVVLGQAGRLMVVGLGMGLIASLATMRLLRTLLYGLSEQDPSVYLAAIGVVVVITLLACWLPAARAARIDPAAALREE